MAELFEIRPFEKCIEKVKYTTKVASQDFKQSGRFPIISQEEAFISGYWDSPEDVFHISKPVVIFGDHSRHIKYIDFDFVIGADGVKILSPVDDINAKYFYYYLRWLDVPSLGYSRHFKSLKEKTVKVFPIDKQQRIVSELDLLTDIIDKKNAQLRDLDTLALSIFYEMFGDPSINEKGWPVVALETIAESRIGLTYKPENVSEEGTIVLRSSNIQESEIDLKDIVRVNCPIKENQYVQEGDILMCSRNGSFKLVGKVAKIGTLPERMSYGAFMTTIRSKYNPYLFEFFKLPAFRTQLGLAKTATINQITVKMLANTKVALPPLDLQRAFEKRVASIYAQKASIKQSMIDCQNLLDSRMLMYFND